MWVERSRLAKKYETPGTQVRLMQPATQLEPGLVVAELE